MGERMLSVDRPAARVALHPLGGGSQYSAWCLLVDISCTGAEMTCILGWGSGLVIWTLGTARDISMQGEHFTFVFCGEVEGENQGGLVGQPTPYYRQLGAITAVSVW